MTTIEDQISKVDTKIEEVELQIAAVERRLEGELSKGDKIYFREKENQLREEENQLREEENQLREKENLFLARQKPQQDALAVDGSATKRQKSFAALLAADKDAALRDLNNAARFIVETQVITPTSSYCVPSMTSNTWNSDAMRSELIALRDAIRPKLKGFKLHDRHEVVIGIRLGSGFGKTHAIVKAPDWLSGQGIYTTYNLKQRLVKDHRHPRKALLLRLILIMSGATPLSCGTFLETDMADYYLEDHVTVELLRELFVHCAMRFSPNRDLVISVDETKELERKEAAIIISELGHLAHAYYQATQLMCTVLVTSLVWENFKTSSGGGVVEWTPKSPDRLAFEWFAHGVTTMDTKQVAALYSAVAGSHMRSLAVARGALLEHTTPSVPSVLLRIVDRMGQKLVPNELKSARAYVIRCIVDKGTSMVPADIEAISDKAGAIPPAVMCLAFEVKLDAMAHHPLLSLLNAFSIYTDPYKQLELVSKAYDVFRQSLGLLVMPGKANLRIPLQEKGVVQFEDEAWYRALVFPKEMDESQDSLIVTVQVKATAKNTAHCKSSCTGVNMTGCYFHPSVANHPLVDRAFVAVHPNGGNCLVLAQDKVNATTFPKAVTDLNEAASLLSAKTGIRDVLLVVNVIGPSEKMESQDQLKFPYILVRSIEVDDFYSINFSPMVRYARERALLST